MKHRLVLLLAVATAAAALLVSGCKSDSGSNEFIPGKGWRPT